VEREIESATRVLLAACGDRGVFGRVVRDEPSGELQLVYAARGSSAKELLDAIAELDRDSWPRKLLRSIAPSADE
jgi:hypothetical protein